MNIYRIDYYNRWYEGFATVQADFTVSATYLLKKEGKLNAYIIKEVTFTGEVDSSQEKIINESYYPRESQDPVPPYKPLDDLKDLQKIFPNVNLEELGLTKRMIRGIRERIDFANKKINVDRIIRHLFKEIKSTENVRPKAYDGYMYCLCAYNNIEDYPFQTFKIYLRYNSQNIELGIPVLNTIESSSIILDLRLNKYTKKTPDKYGVFIIKKGSLAKCGNTKYIPVSGSLFASVEEATSWVYNNFTTNPKTYKHTNNIKYTRDPINVFDKLRTFIFPYSNRNIKISNRPYYRKDISQRFKREYIVFFIGKADTKKKVFYGKEKPLRCRVCRLKGPIEKEVRLYYNTHKDQSI